MGLCFFARRHSSLMRWCPVGNGTTHVHIPYVSLEFCSRLYSFCSFVSEASSTVARQINLYVEQTHVCRCFTRLDKTSWLLWTLKVLHSYVLNCECGLTLRSTSWLGSPLIPSTAHEHHAINRERRGSEITVSIFLGSRREGARTFTWRLLVFLLTVSSLFLLYFVSLTHGADRC